MNIGSIEVEISKTDILILGSGGAGLFAALHAKQANPDLDVSIAVKGLLGKSGCTRMVQGGYNVALNPGDSIERHFMDTIVGGKWLPRQDLAWKLCETAVERIRELENELGCFFDRNPDGTLHQKAFAGQSFDRTAHKGDLTGIEIINRLMEKVWSLEVNKLEEHRAIELIPGKDGSGISGVLMIDIRSGKYRFVQAKTVLLGTGAGPSMYRYHTPSGDKTCDGLAMALRYGLSLRDMEMVQFHPTGILAGKSTRMTGTILEEGLRGAGGYLLNGEGNRFMSHYHPAAERATRDIVSRSMYNEIREGRTTPQGGLFIEMAHLGPDVVSEKFPGMVKRCRDCGFDLAGGRVEVVPTAHYMMGGVEMDIDCATASPGLYVAGEDAGGVHGANRLGGNGVANSTVYGGIAGEEMARAIAAGAPHRDPDNEVIKNGVNRAEYPFSQAVSVPAAGEDLLSFREKLWEDMWDHVGIVRNKRDMVLGKSKIRQTRNGLMEYGIVDGERAFNLTWHDWLNIENLLLVSEVITDASLGREDSRGAHFREDYPETGDLDTTSYTRVKMDGEQVCLEMVPVEFSVVQPGESLIDDEGRGAAANDG